VGGAQSMGPRHAGGAIDGCSASDSPTAKGWGRTASKDAEPRGACPPAGTEKKSPRGERVRPAGE